MGVGLKVCDLGFEIADTCSQITVEIFDGWIGCDAPADASVGDGETTVGDKTTSAGGLGGFDVGNGGRTYGGQSIECFECYLFAVADANAVAGIGTNVVCGIGGELEGGFKGSVVVCNNGFMVFDGGVLNNIIDETTFDNGRIAVFDYVAME